MASIANIKATEGKYCQDTGCVSDKNNLCFELPSCHHRYCEECLVNKFSMCVEQKQSCICGIKVENQSSCKTVIDGIEKFALSEENKKVIHKSAIVKSKLLLKTYKIHMRSCPSCKCKSLRNKDTDRWVVCSKCRTNFCFWCGKTWNNGQCCKYDPWLNILETCPLKEMTNKQMAPSIRACTRCGCMIAHAEKCKHMTCGLCKQQFCMVCLQSPDSNAIWPCGKHYEVCKGANGQPIVAERQKSLPRMDQYKF